MINTHFSSGAHASNTPTTACSENNQNDIKEDLDPSILATPVNATAQSSQSTFYTTDLPLMPHRKGEANKNLLLTHYQKTTDGTEYSINPMEEKLIEYQIDISLSLALNRVTPNEKGILIEGEKAYIKLNGNFYRVVYFIPTEGNTNYLPHWRIVNSDFKDVNFNQSHFLTDDNKCGLAVLHTEDRSWQLRPSVNADDKKNAFLFSSLKIKSFFMTCFKLNEEQIKNGVMNAIKEKFLKQELTVGNIEKIDIKQIEEIYKTEVQSVYKALKKFENINSNAKHILDFFREIKMSDSKGFSTLKLHLDVVHLPDCKTIGQHITDIKFIGDLSQQACEYVLRNFPNLNAECKAIFEKGPYAQDYF